MGEELSVATAAPRKRSLTGPHDKDQSADGLDSKRRQLDQQGPPVLVGSQGSPRRTTPEPVSTPKKPRAPQLTVDTVRYFPVSHSEGTDAPAGAQEQPAERRGPPSPARRGALACHSFLSAARRVKQEGRLQYHKMLALIRCWETLNFTRRADMTCGTSWCMLRMLLSPLDTEEGQQVPQQPVPYISELLTVDPAVLLSCRTLPTYVAELLDDPDAAAFGYVVWRGQMHIWATERFERAFFPASYAQKVVGANAILPELLFASLIAPADRKRYYEKLMEHFVTASSENTEMSLIAEVADRDAHVQRSLVRGRHVILNDGQYCCLALSITAAEDPSAEVNNAENADPPAPDAAFDSPSANSP